MTGPQIDERLEALIREACRPKPFGRLWHDVLHIDATILAHRVNDLMVCGKSQKSIERWACFAVHCDELTSLDYRNIGPPSEWVAWRVATFLNDCLVRGTRPVKDMARAFLASRSLDELSRLRAQDINCWMEDL